MASTYPPCTSWADLISSLKKAGYDGETRASEFKQAKKDIEAFIGPDGSINTPDGHVIDDDELAEGAFRTRPLAMSLILFSAELAALDDDMIADDDTTFLDMQAPEAPTAEPGKKKEGEPMKEGGVAVDEFGLPLSNQG